MPSGTSPSSRSRHPTPVAGDLVCVSGYSLVGRTRDPLVAWLATLPDDVVVVLDPGATFAELDARTRDAVLERTSVWTGNAEESAALSGVTGVEETAQVVATLLRPDAVTIVRDGPRGCAVREGGRTAYLPGHPQRPVDTNGAGDTHTGVLLAERAAGCVVDGCRGAGQRRGRHQGDPSRPGHRADARGDRRLPRRVAPGR